MSRFALALVALILSSSFVYSQDSLSKVQVFAGYSFLRADTGGLNGAVLDSALATPTGTFGVANNFSGWNAEAQYNVRRWFGIAADFGGHYGMPLTTASGSGVSGLPDANEYSFLFGPVISYHARWRLVPFAHALVGMDRASLAASTPTGLTLSSSAVTDTAFAAAFGGGLDVNVSLHFALRPAQLDYLYTGHDLNSVYGGAFGPGLFSGLANHENNLRFSTGVVLRF